MPFMSHPDLPDHIEVTESQARVLAKSGWKPVALEDLPKSTLLAEAQRRGAPTKKSARKAEIAEAIKSIEPEEG